MLSEDKTKLIRAAMADLSKRYRIDPEELVALGANEALEEQKNIEAISTSSFSLDRAIGIGGIPRGRLVEIYGLESSGKTTLSLTVIANEQKNGGIAAFIDTEHAVDLEWAKRLGVNLEDLILSQPDSGEQMIDIVIALAESTTVSLIVVDSVAASQPQSTIDAETGKRQIAELPRLLSQELPKVNIAAHKNNCTVIFLNQCRDNIQAGGTWGYAEPYTQPGGHAMKHYASLRMETKASTKDEDKGRWFNVMCVKNKVGTPFRKGRYYLSFTKGIDRYYELFDIAKNEKIVQAKGPSFAFNPVLLKKHPEWESFPKPFGTEKLIEQLRTNKEYAAAVAQGIEEMGVEVAPKGSQTDEFEVE